MKVLIFYEGMLLNEEQGMDNEEWGMENLLLLRLSWINCYYC